MSPIYLSLITKRIDMEYWKSDESSGNSDYVFGVDT